MNFESITKMLPKVCQFCTTPIHPPRQISLDYTNPKLKAAGTLIYAINPQDKKTYVLLAKERVWEGPNSDKWKSFGGKQDPGETLIETALRETKEESRGLIDIKKDQIPFDQLIAVEHYQCKYLQLTLRVEYDHSINARFQGALFEDKHFMEKTEVRWVPLDELNHAVQRADELAKATNTRPFHQDVDIQYNGETFSIGHDFIETMTILHREAPEVLKTLHRGSNLLISDKDWTTN